MLDYAVKCFVPRQPLHPAARGQEPSGLNPQGLERRLFSQRGLRASARAPAPRTTTEGRRWTERRGCDPRRGVSVSPRSLESPGAGWDSSLHTSHHHPMPGVGAPTPGAKPWPTLLQGSAHNHCLDFIIIGLEDSLPLI